MDTVRRSLVLGVFFVVCTSALLAGQESDLLQSRA